MRINYPPLLAAALFVITAGAEQTCFGQLAGGVRTAASLAKGEEATPPPPRVFLILVGGSRVEAEEVSEKSEGFWFRRGNVWTLLDRLKVARVERESPAKNLAPNAPAATKPELPRWTLSDSARVEAFFMKRFGQHLPVTAFGQSDLHTRWGYDHRRSMDVGLHPDSPEGRALMAFLAAEGIPFMGFRSAIPGVASAPHIHVGLPSRRLKAR